MSLRLRLTLLVTLCVGGAVVVVSSLAYFATEARLVNEIDETLRGRARFIAEVPGPDDFGANGLGQPQPGPVPRRGIPSIDVFQIIDGDGTLVVLPMSQGVELPVGDRDRRVATGESNAFFHNAEVDGEEYRVFSAPGQAGQAVLVARSLAEVNSTLNGLRNILIVVSAAGIAIAAALGALVAHRSLRPIRRLTAAAEHVAATQDLSHSIAASERDEIGRLAASFNTMLSALHTSREQQRRLVSDASHELRTPLTSLRTNVEVLASDSGLDPEKQAILRDAVLEIGELTKIVSELVDLAMDPRSEERARFDVRMDELAATVVERARRRSGLRIDLGAEPTLVVGNPELLERALSNLIDNACKWSAPNQVVSVTVKDGRVSVSDAGPGIAPEDLPHVFERFYRGDDARSKPGSGLGLAIVKQVVEAHGGAVRVESERGRGTVVTFNLPTVAFDSAGV